MDDRNKERFTGIRALHTEAGFAKLQRACVLIAGCGGVGSWIAEALCRSGVGQLILIDPDRVEIKNTNRQLHTLDNTLGRLKVEVLAERLRLINPGIDVQCRPVQLTREELSRQLDPCPHYAADAIDDIEAKCALINFLTRQQAVFVVSGGAGARLDPCRLHLADMAAAQGDGLIKHVRDILRREYNFPKGGRKFGVKCVYSDESPHYTAGDNPELPRFGAGMPVTTTAGLIMASYLIGRIVED